MSSDLCPTTSTISVAEVLAAFSRLYSRIGLPRGFSMHLFSSVVSSPSREPRPAASTSAFKSSPRRFLVLKIGFHEIRPKKPVLGVPARMLIVVPSLALFSLWLCRRQSNAVRQAFQARGE